MEHANYLSTKGLRVWRIYGIIETLILLLVAIGLSVFNYFFFEQTWLYLATGATVLILGFLFIGVIPTVKWKRWRYEVRDQEIELQHGLFIVKRTLIPMVRVQHVDTEQGPILRHHDLASIHISTAATQHTIPVLDVQEAEGLRRKISELARVAEDDV